jgi:hypothetical protein
MTVVMGLFAAQVQQSVMVLVCNLLKVNHDFKNRPKFAFLACFHCVE